MWYELTPAHPLEGGVIRGDHSCACAALNGHVADSHAAFHVESANGFTSVFDDVSSASCSAHLSDGGENHIFGGDADREFAVEAHFHSLWTALSEGLRSEDVLHLGCADAECERTERAMRGCVGVTTDDGHARLGVALLRSDDMNNALPTGVDVV